MLTLFNFSFLHISSTTEVFSSTALLNYTGNAIFSKIKISPTKISFTTMQTRHVLSTANTDSMVLSNSSFEINTTKSRSLQVKTSELITMTTLQSTTYLKTTASSATDLPKIEGTTSELVVISVLTTFALFCFIVIVGQWFSCLVSNYLIKFSRCREYLSVSGNIIVYTSIIMCYLPLLSMAHAPQVFFLLLVSMARALKWFI